MTVEKFGAWVTAAVLGVGASQTASSIKTEAEVAAAYTAPIASSEDMLASRSSPKPEAFPMRELPSTGYFPKGPIAHASFYEPKPLKRNDAKYELKKTSGGPVAVKKTVAAVRPKAVTKPKPLPVKKPVTQPVTQRFMPKDVVYYSQPPVIYNQYPQYSR